MELSAIAMYLLFLPLISSSSNMFQDYWKYQHYEQTVTINGGQFQMGSRNAKLTESGEYPPRKLDMKSLQFDKYPVTNSQYWNFQQMSKGKSRTAAEKLGYSHLFATAYNKNMTRLTQHSVPKEPWWLPVKGVKWNKPEGAMSNITWRMNWPVVHVSQANAQIYCEWNNKRLPTEAEWEFAARGGLSNKPYPWGDSLQANRTNLWQGLFPYENKRYDGYEFLSPVDAYPQQNEYGMHDMLGNVWEWTSTPATNIHIDEEVEEKYKGQKFYILKGASFIDFREDKANINHAARISNRLARSEQFTSQNVGFRCVSDYVAPLRTPTYHRAETTPITVIKAYREEL